MRFFKFFIPVAAVLTLTTLFVVSQRRQLTPEERAARQAAQARQLEEDLKRPRPIAALDSIWIEELTWMEVRDEIKAGKTIAIIATGGMEQNGPYLAIGKHNYVLQGACEGIARNLGNALCAPIMKLVPEGSIDPPSGHMRYPGTISLREETFRAVLEDVAGSLAAHGFKHVILIGDSGGNQRGMDAVAKSLNEDWTHASAHFIPEFYRYQEVIEWMGAELGIKEPSNDGLHDDFAITALMMITDPQSVRHSQRVAAGKASINGISIADKEKAISIGKKLMAYRVEQTVKAIRSAISNSSR